MHEADARVWPGSEDIAAQILVLHQFAQMPVDVVEVYGDLFAIAVGSLKGDRFQQALHDRVQAAGADVFLLRSFTWKAISARRCTPLSAKPTVTPSVASSAWYCSVSEAIRLGQDAHEVVGGPSAPTARRGSAGGPAVPESGPTVWRRWKAPEAMNRMWSVFTMPCLVLDGAALNQRQQVALHALAGDVGALGFAPARHTLSISSMKTMPFCSTFCSAARLTSSSLIRLAASSS
jgi:hypothetical protein